MFPLKVEEHTYVKCGGFGESGGIAALGKVQQQAVREPLRCMGGRQSVALNTCHQFGEI